MIGRRGVHHAARWRAAAYAGGDGRARDRGDGGRDWSRQMTNAGGTAAPPNVAAERYREILDRRDADEIRTLAHAKRFLERYVADPGFRDKLKQKPEAPHLVAESYGISD